MSRPRVLILSTTTGYQLRSFADAAERLEVDLLFATDRCHQLDDPWRDRAIAVRFHRPRQSVDAVARESLQRPIAGLLAVGDRPTYLAALVAERLGLPGNRPDAAEASGNKRETRRRFERAGLPVPWYFTLPATTAAWDAVTDSRMAYPCVLKPLGLSGSRGVIRADGPAAFESAFTRIQSLLRRVDVRAARTGLEGEILVEGFIPGQEFALEGVLTDGMLQAFAIFDKPDPLDGPFFEETIYLTPTRLPTSVQILMHEAVNAAAAALGLEYGPVHAECRVGPLGMFVLEVAARPIGGLCSKTLRFEGGLSLEEVLLRHALGEDVARYRQEPTGAAVMMIPIPRRGLLKSIRGDAEARQVPGIEDVRITAKIDQLLEPLPESGSYLGFIFARTARPEEAERAVRKAHSRLAFDVDPAIAVLPG